MADFPLLNEASLVMIPGASKEGKVYSQVPTDGNGDFTFTRSTSATRVNEAGNIEKGYENLLYPSNDFSTWTNVNSSDTSGQEGYDGSNDATLLEASAVSGVNIYKNISQNGVYTFNVYAKSGTQDFLGLYSTGASTRRAVFDLNQGIVGNEIDVIDSSMVSIGDGWYRCSITFNASSNTQLRIYVFSSLTSSSVSVGDNIYIQDAQLNQGLVAYPYLETTTAPVYGGLQADQPRLDYTDATCPSLLLEPSRTNLIANSEYIAGSFRSVVTYNQAVSPEGVNNAILALDTTNPGDSQVGPTIVNAPSGTSTMVFSIFVKKYNNRYIYLKIDDNPANIGGTVNLSWATFDLEDGVVTSEGTFGSPTNPFNGIEDYGNGWYRCWVGVTKRSGVTRTDARVFLVSGPNNPNQNPQPPGTGVNGNYLYGYQCEEGSYPTSYIPTYGSAQTRASETTTSTFNSSSTGTISVSLGKVSESHFTVLGESFAANATRNDIAIAYSPTALKISLNGAIVVNATGTYDTSSLSSLQLGHDNGSDQLGGGVDNLIMFNDFLTDTELNAITV